MLDLFLDQVCEKLLSGTIFLRSISNVFVCVVLVTAGRSKGGGGSSYPKQPVSRSGYPKQPGSPTLAPAILNNQSPARAIRGNPVPQHWPQLSETTGLRLQLPQTTRYPQCRLQLPKAARKLWMEGCLRRRLCEIRIQRLGWRSLEQQIVRTRLFHLTVILVTLSNV